MSKYSISLESSGDLIKDGFESESKAYEWITSQGEELEGLIIEKENEDDSNSND